ncbi:hypothetical protein PQX77_004313 [Marasmius sp. AFHP31]|nr:hypothetical protein PQX77_004313 [Marasmius sp. AFHP31]
MAESHTIQVVDKYGTPKLIQAGRTRSSRGIYASSGPLTAAIAYLQTGPSSQRGHKFNVPTNSHYTSGCSNGAAQPDAFHKTLTTGPSAPARLTTPSSSALAYIRRRQDDFYKLHQ